MTYGYLRVSTVEQDNNKFQGEILLYSNKNHLGHVSFVEEKVTGVKDWKQRELGTLINTRCKSGDNIIVSELSRMIDRPDRMDHILRIEAIAFCDYGFTSVTSSDCPALFQQFRTRCPMDGSVHTASAQKGCICGIHNRIGVHSDHAAPYNMQAISHNSIPHPRKLYHPNPKYHHPDTNEHSSVYLQV